MAIDVKKHPIRKKGGNNTIPTLTPIEDEWKLGMFEYKKIPGSNPKTYKISYKWTELDIAIQGLNNVYDCVSRINHLLQAYPNKKNEKFYVWKSYSTLHHFRDSALKLDNNDSNPNYSLLFADLFAQEIWINSDKDLLIKVSKFMEYIRQTWYFQVRKPSDFIIDIQETMLQQSFNHINTRYNTELFSFKKVEQPLGCPKYILFINKIPTQFVTHSREWLLYAVEKISESNLKCNLTEIAKNITEMEDRTLHLFFTTRTEQLAKIQSSMEDAFNEIKANFWWQLTNPRRTWDIAKL